MSHEKIKHLLAYCEFEQVGPLCSHGVRVKHSLSGAVGESTKMSGLYANKRAAVDALMETPEFKQWYSGDAPTRTAEAYARFRKVVKDLADSLPDKIEDSQYADYLMWHLEELLETVIEKIESITPTGTQEERHG